MKRSPDFSSIQEQAHKDLHEDEMQAPLKDAKTPLAQSILLFATLLFLNTTPINAQNIFDARQSVMLEATVQADPPRIVLNWVLDTANGGYTIWRKDKSDTQWGDSLATIGPGSISWTDTSVVAGMGYEYQVLKSLPAFPYGNGTPNFGAGYIYSAIQLPPTHHRGACLVVIDSTFKQALAPEIARLLADIQADGWQGQAIYIDRNDLVPTVKAYIKSWAETHPDNNQCLLLFGRVPVPYAGFIAPDGHDDHRGAWPCDGFYANLDGTWTDQTINVTSPPGTRNDNVPGDGKFDNSVFPTPIKLQVGRVDFSNMTKFPESEEQLLRRYLDKDHAWRTGMMPMLERGLVDNNFPADLDGFGEAGWKNFTPMFGFSNVKDLPYRQTLSNQSYMWSYGCGGGGPESASDISSTMNFTTDSLQMAFTMIFGSYFGDWDYPNDFLRGAIASRTCLISTWGNRPVWFLHHMALGEHIGYSALTTMTNLGLHTPRYYGSMIHSALMGDPTLRMHMFRPVENLQASQAGLSVQLDWQDPVGALGYYVYKKTPADTAYQLLNQVPLTATTYLDSCAGQGLISYMVRSVELRSSASGTYYNLSTGISASIQSDPVPFTASLVITPTTQGQSNGSIAITPQGGCIPYIYAWDTGQSSAEIQGLDPGVYCVTVADCHNCSEVYCATIDLASSTSLLPALKSHKLYPNPVHDNFVLELNFETFQSLELDIIDVQGHIMAHQQCTGTDFRLFWDVGFLAAGVYRLRIASPEGYVLLNFTVGE
ncbi:MAG: SprB repeat-containing protein [Lewinellaceae bacterium]|nr:SprB repeat-containing protein [Lewinellaceae bacterium]